MEKTEKTNMGSIKSPTYNRAYIVAFVIILIEFSACVALFSLVTYQASGIILGLANMFAVFAAFTVALLLCMRCAKEHKLKIQSTPVPAEDSLNFFASDEKKIKNPNIYFAPRDTFYYLKRVGFFAIMIVLMDVAASFVGMCVVALFGGALYMIDNMFVRELVVKLPMFVLYISLVYKMLVRFGFIDSQKKIYNIDFKIITFLVSVILMMPSAVCDSFFDISATESLLVNIQTVLTSNAGSYIMEDGGFMEINESFGASNIFLICIALLVTFAFQIGIFWFAYSRGKKIMIAEHIRKVDEYEMDENI